MKELEQAIKYAAAKRKNAAIVFALCFFSIIMFGILEQSGEKYSIVITILAVIIIFMIIIWRFQSKFGRSQRGFMQSSLYKDLEHLGYLQEFTRTIDSEMKNNLKFQYKDKTYHLNLYVTSNWFLFISANGSTIRKVSDISGIYRDFLPTHSTDVLRIEFSDGSSFSNTCNYACDDIILLFEKEFPTLSTRVNR